MSSVIAARCRATNGMRRLLAVLPLLVGACVHPAAGLEPSAGPSSSDVRAIVSAACSGSAYRQCVPDLTEAFEMYRGVTVAICEYGGEDGDVVIVERDTAADACTHHGTTSMPAKVHGTVVIPR